MPLRSGWINTVHGMIDPKWRAVDEWSFSKSHPKSRPNTKALQDTLKTSEAGGLPDYGLSPSQGKFLALHCQSAGVTNVLEVGTLGGYSAIWMASENAHLRLTTVEYDRRHVEVARQNIQRAGLSDRIEVIHGSGIDVLGKLREQIKAGSRQPFGFVFIDADKKSNWEYFRLSKEMVNPNSVICIDNIVRQGQLADVHDSDPDVVASRLVVEKAGKEPGVNSVVLQTVGEKSYDGWLWAVVS